MSGSSHRHRLRIITIVFNSMKTRRLLGIAITRKVFARCYSVVAIEYLLSLRYVWHRREKEADMTMTEYRKRADECVEIAQTARTPAQRTMLLHIAETWMNLARDAEINS